jgi:hypothetical protein
MDDDGHPFSCQQEKIPEKMFIMFFQKCMDGSIILVIYVYQGKIISKSKKAKI